MSKKAPRIKEQLLTSFLVPHTQLQHAQDTRLGWRSYVQDVSWVVPAVLRTSKFASLVTPAPPMTLIYCSGAVTAIMTNPIWVVKVRMFTTRPEDPTAYRSLWSEFYYTLYGRSKTDIYF